MGRADSKQGKSKQRRTAPIPDAPFPSGILDELVQLLARHAAKEWIITTQEQNEGDSVHG